MKDSSKTKQVLIHELAALRQRIEELEIHSLGSKQKQIEDKSLDSMDSGGVYQKDGEFFQAITERSSNITFVLDRKGRITYASPSVAHLLGYQPQELLGKSSLDLILPSDIQGAIDEFGKAIATKGTFMIPRVLRVRHKDGSERVLEGTGTNLLDDPAVAGFVINVCDVSDIKKAEEELRQSEENFRTLIELTPDIIFRVDRRGSLIYVNPMFEKTTGYTCDQLMGQPLTTLIAPEHREAMIDAFRRGIKVDTGTTYESEILRADGTRIPVEFLSSTLRDKEGKSTGRLGIGRDITKRKRIEEKLIISESKYRNLVDNSLIGVYLTDLSGSILYTNQTFADMLKYDSPEELMSINAVSLYKNQKVRQKFIETLKKDKVIRNYDLTLLTKTGEEKDFILSGSLDGYTVSGTLVDITERKKVAMEREYLSTFPQMNPDPIVEMNPAGQINYMNPAAEKLFPELREQGVTNPWLKRLEEIVRDLRTNAASQISREIAVGDKWYLQSVQYVEKFRSIRVYGRDVSERKQIEKQRILVSQILETLNSSNEIVYLVRDILVLIKDHTEIEAVGVRLREGDDFPYYATEGFPFHFIETERYLCARDQTHEIIRNSQGDPYLECMCGNVICGRTDPSLPFFSKRGSFWSNNTSALLATTSDAERQSRTRNRCNSEGYESVALIPLRAGDEIIGLLQLNDKRTNRFTLQLIEFFERVGVTIGIAVQRMRAAKTLGESEEKYRDLVETAREGIYQTTPEGHFITANRALANMLGYSSPAELVAAIVDIKNQLYVIPEDRDILYNVIDMHGDVREFETRLYRKDGSVIWVAIHGRHVYNESGLLLYYQGLCQDISERKQAEEALRAAEDLYRTLAMNSLTAIYITQEGKICFSNPFLSQYSGYTAEELLGMNILSFVHSDDREMVKKKAIEMLKGETRTPYEYRIMDKKGGYRWVMEVVSPMTYEGKRATLGNTMDITEHKKVEKDLENSKNMLLQSEKLAAIGKLTAGVAHEILNPINILSGRLQLMEIMGSLSEEIQEGLKICQAQIERIVKIARSMSEFSQSTAKKVERGNLNKVISDTLNISSPRLRMEDITTLINLSPDLPAIAIDRFRMEQVILNIINNSIDAMHGTDKKILDINTRVVTRGGQEVIQIEIADTGAGIKTDHLNRIFEPFFTTKDPDKGTGLGLSICFRIIQDHGGTIRAENKEKGGTAFIIELPFQRASKIH